MQEKRKLFENKILFHSLISTAEKLNKFLFPFLLSSQPIPIVFLKTIQERRFIDVKLPFRKQIC